MLVSCFVFFCLWSVFFCAPVVVVCRLTCLSCQRGIGAVTPGCWLSAKCSGCLLVHPVTCTPLIPQSSVRRRMRMTLEGRPGSTWLLQWVSWRTVRRRRTTKRKQPLCLQSKVRYGQFGGTYCNWIDDKAGQLAVTWPIRRYYSKSGRLYQQRFYTAKSPLSHLKFLKIGVYKVACIIEWLIRDSCLGRVDVHVKSPAGEVQTSTFLVMFAIYMLFLGR